MRGTSRREIGHGVLAEKAISKVLPSEDEFPYTIRIVSDILESNGSSSMASVCGASLALMDAGVPISKAVAGVAMGMMSDAESGDYAILTDIQGMEDHYGDMDYKVAGTGDGITSFQMDLKVEGISIEIMREAMEQARRARMFILGKMDSVLAEPRSELSPYAPRLVTFYIPIDKIGAVIGPGGKNIRRIISETGVEIDIEDDGRVTIASTDGEAAAAAREEIDLYTAEAEVGKVYKGKVVRIMNFGAFVEIIPGIDGMVHISDLEWHRVGKVEDVLNVGDEVEVKVMEIDDQGRVNLSRKELIPRPEGGGRDYERKGDRKKGDRRERDKRGDKKRRR
jgi:polyribonucleotide nucleotidyltransferase